MEAPILEKWGSKREKPGGRQLLDKQGCPHALKEFVSQLHTAPTLTPFPLFLNRKAVASKSIGRLHGSNIIPVPLNDIANLYTFPFNPALRVMIRN